MKLISSPLYFDYNSTSPLSPEVLKFLREGEVDFFNASSIHKEGRRAKKVLNDCRNFLFDCFQLPKDCYQCTFHSGATEGLNTIIKSHALDQSSPMLFVFSMADHPAGIENQKFLERLGHRVNVIKLPLNLKAQQSWEESLFESYNEPIKEYLGNDFTQNTKKVFLYWSWVLSESGVELPLTVLGRLKDLYGESLITCVDAVQTPFKIPHWNKLIPTLDYYVYSGHKFGALKGIGFTFERLSSNHKMFSMPLLHGGGQEAGNRSGTQNPLGVLSLRMALESQLPFWDFKENSQVRENFELALKQFFYSKNLTAKIIGEGVSHRASNTIFLFLKDVKVESLLAFLDAEGFSLSMGSACQSQTSKSNPTLLMLGENSKDAKSTIRISFSPWMSTSDSEIIIPQFVQALMKFFPQR